MKFENLTSISQPIQFYGIKLCRTIEKIRLTLGYDLQTFCEILQLTPHDYAQCKIGAVELPIKNLFFLCEELQINPTLLMSGKLDLDALVRQKYGDQIVWPEKYSIKTHQLARARGILSIIRYIDQTRNPEYTQMLLGRTQVKPYYFEDQNLFISAHVTADITAELSKEGFSETEIRYMGMNSYELCKNSEVGKLFSEATDPIKLWAFMHDHKMIWFDHLFEYKITALNKDGCRLEARPRDVGTDIFKSNVVGNRSMCCFKQGTFTSMLKFVHSSAASVEERACLYLGDSKCIYDMNWPAKPVKN